MRKPHWYEVFADGGDDEVLRFWKKVYPDLVLFRCTLRRFPFSLLWCSSFRRGPGEPDYLVEREATMKFIKTSLGKAAKKTRDADMPDLEFAKAFPATTEFLTCRTGEKGEIRQTATLTIFAQDGFLKAFLNDRETSKFLAVAAKSFGELWAALESAIVADDPDWRTRTEEGSKRPQKRS